MIKKDDIAKSYDPQDETIGKGIGIERIRRITGYLVGTVDRFCNAKHSELNDRVVHMGEHEGKPPKKI